MDNTSHSLHDCGGLGSSSNILLNSWCKKEAGDKVKQTVTGCDDYYDEKGCDTKTHIICITFAINFIAHTKDRLTHQK